MRINGSTKLLGLIGCPLEHSLSPLIHNTFINDVRENLVYLPFEIIPENFKQGIEGLKALNVKGFNVTIPYKERIIELLDEVSEESSFIGAVNTVVNKKGRLIGYNTDCKGFSMALKENNIKLRGLNVLVIGAGGAAKAVVYQLIKENAKSIVLTNRTEKRAEDLVKSFNKITNSLIKCIKFDETELVKNILDIDVIINTTPVGMYPDSNQCIIQNNHFFKKDKVYCDIIYNPVTTKFLKQAQEVGAKTIGGLDMLIYQACYSFKLWSGILPDHKKVRKLAVKHLND